MKKSILLIVSFLIGLNANSQCIIECNQNIGVYSDNNASTIAYDNMGTSFHSTFVREPNGYRVWGELMGNNGTSHLLNPLTINSTSYPALTGTVYHVGLGSFSINTVQLIVLTSTGLFASGDPGEVVSTAILPTSTFAKLTVNGKADGLPTGVSPSQVKMMFVSDWTIIITTCTGDVYVLSQYVNVRGAQGAGTATSWTRVLRSNGLPLTNIIAARGSGTFGYALRADSTLWTWGDNIYLGNGAAMTSSNSALQMTLPAGMPGIKMIQATYQFTTPQFSSFYILGNDKKVYALGTNTFGQLGDNTTTERLVWVNSKYTNGTVINNAAWISSNEHDIIYPNLSIINTDYQINLCGINQTFMIGRTVNNGTNYLNLPTGISTTDTITHCEVGGHTTSFIKYKTTRYGYVGHHINGSLGNGSSTNSTLTSVDFNTPPIINVCGTSCDTPILTKKPFSCFTNQAIFYIKAKAGGKVKYRINNGSIDSVIIGTNDSATIIINNPGINQNFQIISYSTIFLGCNLNLNITDTIQLKKYSTVNLSICSNQTYLWNGVNLNTAGSYLDTFIASNGCDSIVTLNLTINPTKSSSFSVTICLNQTYLWNGINRNTAGAFLDTFPTSLGCDSVVTLNLTVNPTKASSINATICSNQTYLWNGINRNTSGAYLDTFLASNSCDSVVTLNLIVNPTKASSVNATICSNQTYLWNGVNLNSAGAYLDTFSASNSCDSVVTLNLIVNPTKASSVNVTICFNQTYLWNGINRNTSGAYLDTFSASNSCDSVVTLNLTVNPTKASSVNATICSNQTYLWNGINRNTSGAYLDTFSASNSCDSVVTLNLTVNPTKTSSVNATICSNQTYLWNGVNLNSAGAFLDTFFASNSCDSVVTLNLIVNPTKASSVNATICSNQTYLWNGVNRNTSGAYLDTFSASNSCDSIITLNLTVNLTKTSSVNATICSNQTYLWNGINRNTSGAYLDTFSASNSCDSVVSLNLTVNPTKTSSVNATICSNQTYLWNGINRNTSGAFLDTFSASNSCDSVVTLNLTVNPTKSSSFNATICSNQSYLWNGINRNTSGVYLDTFSASNSCDSVVILNLTVNSTKASSFNATICSNQSYLWNGINRNTTGAYLDTFSASNSCDSVVTLNLSVNPTKTSSVNATICSNQTYLWKGVNRNTSGSYLDTFTASNGCDSVVTLNLMVNPAKTTSFGIAICSNQIYFWNGVNLNTAGSYLDTFSTSLGCDSVVTLNLTVNSTKASSFNATICSNQSYLWNGVNRNTAGAYLDTFSTSLGCDSVVTLNLIVNPTKASTINATICSNQSYLWNGVNRNTSGAYLDTFSASNSCDSVVTLNLTVNPTKASSINITICSNQSYLWNGVNKNTAGAYLDTFSTSLGCDSVVTLNLIVNPTKASSFSESICFNQTYLWNGVNRNIAGVYLDTFSTSLGCDSVVTLNLSVNSLPNSSMSQESTKCYGSSTGKAKVMTSLGNDPYTFLWSSGETLDSIINKKAGKYFITVKDSNQCLVIDSIIIFDIDSIKMSLNVKHIDCFGDSTGSASIIAEGGTGIFNYLWTNGSTNDSIENLKIGNYGITVTDNNVCSKSNSANINQSFKINNSSYKIDSVSCFGGNNGKVKVNYQGGKKPYTYTWNVSPIVIDSVLSNLNSNTYYLEIKDSLNCKIFDSIYIPQPAKINLTSINKNSTCFGESNGEIELKANGGVLPFSYSLGSSFNLDSSFKNLQIGNYVGTIKDQKGCRDSIAIILIEPADIKFTIDKVNSSCIESNNGKAIIHSISGGTSPYTYLWSDGQTNDTAINLKGEIWIKGTLIDSQQCKKTDSIFIGSDYKLNTSIFKDSITCPGGNDGKARVIVLNGYSPFSYNWNTSPIQSLDSAIGLKKGTYSLTTTDMNQCIKIDQISIEEPNPFSVIFNLRTPSCFLKSDGKISFKASGGNAPYIYQWMVNPPVYDTIIQNIVSGDYSIEILDNKNCIDTFKIFLPQPNKDLLIQLIEKQDSRCKDSNNGKINIVGTGGTPPYNYLWNVTPNQNQGFIQNLVANKTYKVTVSDINNCKDTSSFFISEPESLNLILTNKEDVKCFNENNGSIAVFCQGGNLPYLFSIDSFKTSSNFLFFENLNKGNYTVLVRDANQCATSIQVPINEPDELLVKIIPELDSIDMCSTLQLETILTNPKGPIPNDVTYDWQPNQGISCADCSNPIVNSFITRTYPLIVSYNKGQCKITKSATIYVRDPEPIFIPNSFSPNGDNLNDSFQVYGHCILTKDVSIFNRWGEKVYHIENIEQGWDGTFKNLPVPAGVYSYVVNITFMNGAIRRYAGELLLVK